MAGLFDFSSAENVLKQRQEATRQNTLGLIKENQRRGKTHGEVAAGNIGTLLTQLAISQFGGPSDESLVADATAAGEVSAVAAKAGVGTSASGFGPEVLRQIQERDKSTLGLLDPELRQEVNKKRLLDSADFSTSESTLAFADRASKSGLAGFKELEHIQARARGLKAQENQAAKVGFMQKTAGEINSQIDRAKDPIGHLTLWADSLRANPLTQTEAGSAEGKLMTALIAKDAKGGGGRKVPAKNVLAYAQNHMQVSGLDKGIDDDNLTAANFFLGEQIETHMGTGMSIAEATAQAELDIQPLMGKTKEQWWQVIGGGNNTLDIAGAVNPEEEADTSNVHVTPLASPSAFNVQRIN